MIFVVRTGLKNGRIQWKIDFLIQILLKVSEMSEIQVEKVPNSGVIFFPSGYIDRELGERLSQMVQECMAEGFETIVIGFGNVKMINSIGISEIIGLMEKIENAEAQLWLADVKEELFPILDVSGLTGLVPPIITIEEARKLLK